jgi:hypothetical protein
MARLNVHDARCAALFASRLQPSDAPSADAVAQAISDTVRRLGCRGCAAALAQEFGDHPETAQGRMRWARGLVAEVARPAIRPDSGAPAGSSCELPRSDTCRAA